MDLAHLYEHLPDAVYIVDSETSNIIGCNRAACTDLGYSREEVLAHSVVTLQRDVMDMAHWRKIVDSVRRSGTFVFIGHHRCANGYDLPVEIRISIDHVDGREVFVSVARDISNRMQQFCLVQQAPQNIWQGLHDLADGVWDWQVDSGQLYFSPNLKRLLGYGPDEMHPSLASWKNNIHPEDAPLVLSILDEHLQGRRHLFEAEYRIKNRNGHYLWIHDRGQVRERDDQGQPVRMIGMLFNLTDLKLQELELQKHADYDALTGLFNRRRGEDLAEQQIALMRRQRRPLGLALIDLDDFKQINDLYGHLAGDQVLQQVATHIAESTRRSDVLFRWGGEEFVLVCPDTDAEGMKRLMQKLCHGIAHLPLPEGLKSLDLTASIGVSIYPRDAKTLVDLVARADSALYTAKHGGKNQVILYNDPCCCAGCSADIG
jgi:diguanylate cyclase (GGDEF)-like protein/PAS domain S-box-containing protein